jgi:mono/diheme cytochrome c family protein
MQRAIVALVRASCAVALFLLITRTHASAVPVLANGQGVSCQTCHTTFPGMTAYGMMTMMSNFQILDWRKQHEALPVALRLQIESFLSNQDKKGSTTVKTLSLFTAGFLGRDFTYYVEQPIVDTGQPGVTEQAWISWNGLLGGTNSLQVGKYHTPFPFMPAHGWTLSDYLLATQDNGQNTFEPNDSHWGVAFNGMSNEFMYNLAYLAGNGPIQQAFDYNRADATRAVDLNVSYGGMTKPYTIGLNAISGTAPLRNALGQYAAGDAFTREGIYYSYQTSQVLFQTMYYVGTDNQPDIGLPAGPLRGFMFEAQRDFGWRDHLLLRYDVGSSDTLNRQYVTSWAHHFLPNFKLTSELLMAPQRRPQIGFALDWAGPFVAGQRYLWKPPATIAKVPVQSGSGQPAVLAATAPNDAGEPSAAPSTGNPNNGAVLVQNSGCMGCHGATFQGGVGPKLFGIEHTRSFAQMRESIKSPRAPMPDFGFSETQIADIVAYLSNLDGGSAGDVPTISFDPASPADHATITVRFPNGHPQQVTARATMQMGTGSHHVDVELHQTDDPHVWQGVVHFSMGGPWVIHIVYGDKHADVPLNVGQ